MKPRVNYLFNFAASPQGGGLKRLVEYSRWFNQVGGAWFIVNRRCLGFFDEFAENRYFYVDEPLYRRAFDDCRYLTSVQHECGIPDLYYSYGIPIYSRPGKLNWFHVSNVLPLRPRGIPLKLRDRIQQSYLGWRIRGHYRNADFISAESCFSLDLVGIDDPARTILSVNGSDDEIGCLRHPDVSERDNVATVIGTSPYKCVEDSVKVFETLRASDPSLSLRIIGEERSLPRRVRGRPGVMVTGALTRGQVIEYLKQSRYYISTTRIENSYNAASEGIFLADESFISGIGPHRELLQGEVSTPARFPGVEVDMMRVTRGQLKGKNLKSWADVIGAMVNRVEGTRKRNGSVAIVSS